ncbi:CRP/FNR family transcriptional regulator, dissimilatory nitrate respiration regulator [uncultured Gammaproteobacteria bacterium]
MTASPLVVCRRRPAPPMPGANDLCPHNATEATGPLPMCPLQTLPGIPIAIPDVCPIQGPLRRANTFPRDNFLTCFELELVRKTPLFTAMSEELVRVLLAEARITAYDAPALLFSCGDAADRFFFVLAGRVKLFVVNAEGRESVIELVEAGSTFAEAAVFGLGRMPVNAETLAGARVLSIPSRILLSRVAADTAFAMLMLASLARWQSHLMGRVMDFKSRAPGQRLAAALLDLTEIEAGPATVQLSMTKTALASHIGVTPESLSRAIARLRRLGVDTRGAEVVIADVAVVRHYCDETVPDD